MYLEFAQIAEEEGFVAIAITFRKIAEVEVEHEKRYRKLIDNIENNRVFEKDEEAAWKCANCGYLHRNVKVPEVCPACLNLKEYFEIKETNY